MDIPNKSRKKVITLAMGPRMRRLIQGLSKENEYYFDLNEEDRFIVANRMKLLVVEEIGKLLNGIDKHNIKFIMEVAVENLTMMRTFFEGVEMYSQCLMMNDAIKQIEDDIQELDSVELQ